MSLITEELKKKRDFYCEDGASLEQIENAERELNTKLAEDYKDYVLKFGTVSCGGHEMTGFSSDINYDVVNVTQKNRKSNSHVNDRLYVIEETHMDGIVIWQAESGEIYKTEYKEKPEMIFRSLLEYVATFENSKDI